MKINMLSRAEIKLIVPALLFWIFLGSLLLQGCGEDDVPSRQNNIELNPAEGRPGATVVVIGDDFAQEKSDNTVTFNGVEALVLKLEYSSDGADRLTVKVPLTATSGAVSVMVNGTVIQGPDFNVIGPHTITDISPGEGAEATEITIHGTYFSTTAEENKVTLNEIPLQVIEASETAIRAILPDDAVTGHIHVEILGLIVEGPVFTVVREPEPVIDQVFPSGGQIGTKVVITGKDLSPEAEKNVVTFNGIQAPVTMVTTENNHISLTVLVPEGASSGPLVVIADGHEARGPVFTVPEENPFINSFTLFPWSFLPGFKFTFAGSGFSPEPSMNKVSVGNIALTVLASGPTFLTVEVPRTINFENAISIKGDLTITVNGRTHTSSDNEIYIWKKPIISLPKKNGKPGDEITILGTTFPEGDSNAVKVFFKGTGGNLNAIIVSVTYSEMKVIVPEGAITGEVSVQVYDGEPGTSLVPFTIEP